VPTARLTRAVRFSAAHRYWRPEWSPERNAEAFGACANEHGHGHNYRCAVTLAGRVADATGMVMSLDALDALLDREVRARFDHRHINHDVPEFAPGRQIPTAEALAVHIWHRLAPQLPDGVRLETVRVEEEADLYAEYHGED
jgi:6-pyruvoyltetrahydropterin/6-carboxytetrahydropterin synthase